MFPKLAICAARMKDRLKGLAGQPVATFTLRQSDRSGDRCRIPLSLCETLPPETLLMKNTHDGASKRTHAQAMQAEIQGAPEIVIPRRQPILDWLKEFLLRSDNKGYVLGETEADDLTSLELFLREYGVPALERKSG